MTEHYTVNSIWEVNSPDVEQEYKDFVLDKATNWFEITVNPHWLNIMNHKDHHPTLSVGEYKLRKKAYEKWLKRNNLEWYIEEVKEGEKLNFETLNI